MLIILLYLTFVNRLQLLNE